MTWRRVPNSTASLNNETVNVFLAVDLRLGHDGLTAYAKEHKVDMADLKTGEAVVFINTKRTHMKSYSWNKVVCVVRAQDINRPIDVDVMDYLAQTFSQDGVMDYPAALKMALETKLKGRKLLAEQVNSKTAKSILKKASKE